ncbi:MAG TPA: adenylate/guanylate cyclase domain-containing protein [Acidimicrobiales bacterium]
MLDADDLHALGLYDPGDEHAEQRLELLRYLADLGATTHDLVAYRDSLPGLAMALAVRGGPAITLTETVERSGLSSEQVRKLNRAAGFADPDSDQPIFTEGFVELAAGLGAAEAFFGEEVLYQLVRVMGAAMARVADAMVSAFLANVEPAARLEDPVGMAVARANADAASLVPMVAPALDVLFRQHLLTAQRTVLDDELTGYETQQLVVGFVDLVGSTGLAEELTMAELGGVLTTFENLASDTVRAAGGRVVKLIGDEIMYTTSDAASACAIALDLADVFRDHPTVPAVRGGLAGGRVMLRDGDVFGPVVNAAARAVKVAAPGEVIAASDVADEAGLSSEPRGHHQLKGISQPLLLHALVRS